MSTSSNAQPAAAPSKGKGVTGTNPDDGAAKSGSGGNNPPPGGQHHPGGKGKKDKD